MPIKNKELFKKYKELFKLDCFIETGSYLGDGIQAALDAGFTSVHSIEIAQKFFDKCSMQFKDNPMVRVYLGDSAKVLNSDILNSFIDENKKVLFWLDGHYSGGDTGRGEVWSPLLQELEGIKNNLNWTNHVIIIDDMRCWNSKDKDFSNYNFTENDIKKKILEINPKYTFETEDGFIESTGRVFKDDILIAYVEE